MAAMLSPPPLPRTLDASLRDLGSMRAATRASAVADLARHALRADDVRAQALPLIEKILAHDDSPIARSAAAVALGDLKGEEALPALLVAIEDADVHVRQMAINALGEIGDARATPRLLRALGDARPEVRYQALIAYAKLAPDAADVIGALARAMSDDDAAVRYIAIRIAEEHMGDAPPADHALAAPARKLLEGGDPHVALAAAIFLAKLGDVAARAIVARVIAGGRAFTVAPEKEDEQEAVELAGRLDLREAIPDLERRAWGLKSFVSDTCAWHAKIALARMNHPKAIAEILRDLTSSRRDLRGAAVVAAGRARVAEARGALEAIATKAEEPELRELAAEALAKLA
jgi:HEAT repeat protein